MDTSQDRNLLERTAAGDARAFEVFVRRWEAPLQRFLRRVTGSDALAEDARQLTLVRVYTRATEYRGGSARVWLFRIAHRVALNLRRSESRAAHAELENEERWAAPVAGPEHLAADAEERAGVRAALRLLDPGDRALLWLRVAEELTFDEIAAVLEVPASTLRYRFTRALARMRRVLEPTRSDGTA